MKSQPIMSIINKWVQAVHDDEQITTFCQEHYGKGPLIMVGYDEQTSPTEEECPYICFHEAERDGADTQSSFAYTVSILWAVVNESYDENNRIRVYHGALEADDLGELILNAVNTVNPSFPLTAIKYVTANESFYPGFLGQAVVTVEIPNVLGAKVAY